VPLYISLGTIIVIGASGYEDRDWPNLTGDDVRVCTSRIGQSVALKPDLTENAVAPLAKTSLAASRSGPLDSSCSAGVCDRDIAGGKSFLIDIRSPRCGSDREDRPATEATGAT
jgi:hypothetical protein